MHNGVNNVSVHFRRLSRLPNFDSFFRCLPVLLVVSVTIHSSRQKQVVTERDTKIDGRNNAIFLFVIKKNNTFNSQVHLSLALYFLYFSLSIISLEKKGREIEQISTNEASSWWNFSLILLIKSASHSSGFVFFSIT